MASLGFPDRACQVDGPRICLLNELPGQYIRTVNSEAHWSVPQGARGTPHSFLSDGHQTEKPRARKGFLTMRHGNRNKEEKSKAAVTWWTWGQKEEHHPRSLLWSCLLGGFSLSEVLSLYVALLTILTPPCHAFVVCIHGSFPPPQPEGQALCLGIFVVIHSIISLTREGLLCIRICFRSWLYEQNGQYLLFLCFSNMLICAYAHRDAQ